MQNDSSISRQRNLTRSYGMSVEDYDSMFQTQRGCCAICRSHESQLKRNLYVDRNPISRKIRGLLCERCTAIARTLDSADALIRVIAYLRGSSYVH
jgi:hypothetical protein